jgi:hypothetical protein
VAKRANYGFVKRQKELKRQQRKDEKAEKKRLKKDSAAGDDQPGVADGDEGDGGPAADTP